MHSSFAAKKLLEIVNAAGVASHPSSRPRYHFGRQVCQPKYKMKSVVVCPGEIGCPSKRKRRYSMFGLQGVMEFLGIDFMRLFAKDLKHDLSVYLKATPSMIASHTRKQLASRHGVFVEDISAPGESVEPELAFSSGEWIRLQGFLDLARETGLLDANGQWSCKAAIVDLKQTRGFSQSICTGSMPCLIRGSVLTDIVTLRKLLVEELFLLQGYAHTALLDASVGGTFPFVGLELPDKVVRDLLGNTMVLSAVGSAWLYMLACTRKTLKPCL